jgi:hypothetical protein
VVYNGDNTPHQLPYDDMTPSQLCTIFQACLRVMAVGRSSHSRAIVDYALLITAASAETCAASGQPVTSTIQYHTVDQWPPVNASTAASMMTPVSCPDFSGINSGNSKGYGQGSTCTNQPTYRSSSLQLRMGRDSLRILGACRSQTIQKHPTKVCC